MSVRGAYNNDSCLKKDEEESLLLLKAPKRRPEDMQTRVRLHSNFTSRFTKGMNFNNLVSDDANVMSKAEITIKAVKKSKHEPRFERQA